MDKIQEMLKLPEMIKLRTEAGIDLDTQKFIKIIKIFLSMRYRNNV
jgi:hypothetical protein